MGNALQKSAMTRPQRPRSPKPVNRIDMSLLRSDESDDDVIFDKTKIILNSSLTQTDAVVGYLGSCVSPPAVPAVLPPDTTREKVIHTPILVYPQTDSSEIKNIADNLPHITENPSKWELSLRAEIRTLSLDARQSRQLITFCCPKIHAYQISEGVKLCRSDGFPYQSSCAQHEEALEKMITHAKSLIRASIDSSVLTLTHQKEGEDVKEFILKFKQLFDRNIALDGGHTTNKHLFNQLLIDALQPHLKVAIQRHDPIFWKSKTIDEMITLAEHFNAIVAPPIPKAKILSVMTPDGHVKLHPEPKQGFEAVHMEPEWGSEARRQHGPQTGSEQGTFSDTSHTQIVGQNLGRVHVCFSCGATDHDLTDCLRPNVDLLFKPKHWKRRPNWVLKNLGKNK